MVGIEVESARLELAAVPTHEVCTGMWEPG